MDIYLEFGNDLSFDENGNIRLVTGSQLSIQRIIRKLLTNPPDYIDNPTYGAGLPKFVGQVNTQEVMEEITGLITSQMFLEQSVSQSPPPVIDISIETNQIHVVITYTDSLTQEQVVVPLTIP